MLSHLSQEEQERRLASQAKIAAGVACRINQQWDDAIAFFEAAIAISPDDPLAHHHLDVCRIYQNRDLEDDWDGALIY